MISEEKNEHSELFLELQDTEWPPFYIDHPDTFEELFASEDELNDI